MKRFFALVLALVFCIAAFSACNENDTEIPSETTGVAESTTTAEALTTTVTTATTTSGKTKFEEIFSPENEALLSTLINDVQNGDVLEDLPEFTKKYTSSAPAGKGGYVHIYEKATLTIFRSYSENLKANGFAQYTKNEFNANNDTSAKNYFATFISKVTQVDIEFHSVEKIMYVNITPRSATVLPAREAPEYTPAGDNYPTMLTQIGHEDSHADTSTLCLVIRIADGSFVIIDAGMSGEAVADRIYTVLRKQAPDPDNIIISAWVITHAHWDHAQGFIDFATKYKKAKTITLKQMVYNFPDESLLDPTDSVIARQQNTESLAKFFNKNVEILKPHTGNVLYYPGVRFNVLYTQENYLAEDDDFYSNYNTCSLVMQMVTDNDIKLFIAADHAISWCGSGDIYKWYGDFIESYITTTFHHGYGGGADGKVYGVIKPKIVLWNVNEYRVKLNGMTGNTFNQYFTAADAETKNGVKYYIAGNKVHVIKLNTSNPKVEEYASVTLYANS